VAPGRISWPLCGGRLESAAQALEAARGARCSVEIEYRDAPKEGAKAGRIALDVAEVLQLEPELAPSRAGELAEEIPSDPGTLGPDDDHADPRAHQRVSTAAEPSERARQPPGCGVDDEQQSRQKARIETG
jgi:hypothetical protein